MAYPRATGFPAHTGNYIPTIYGSKLIANFYDSAVVPFISNTDYEGEIKKMGDTVVMRTTPSITISDYEMGQNLSYENPSKDAVNLLIDKGKSWSFILNTVFSAQTDIKKASDEWADDASMQIKEKVDADVFQNIYSDAATYNYGATAGAVSQGYNLGTSGNPITLSKADILEYIVDMGSVLDEQNVPETNRWLVLPAQICGLIKKSDLKDASLAGDNTSVMRNGRLGIIDRFTVYRSNQVYLTSSKYYCIAGHPSCLTFAAQVVEKETLPNPNDFGQLHRGLLVYGYKVSKGEGICYMIASV